MPTPIDSTLIRDAMLHIHEPNILPVRVSMVVQHLQEVLRLRSPYLPTQRVQAAQEILQRFEQLVRYIRSNGGQYDLARTVPYLNRFTTLVYRHTDLYQKPESENWLTGTLDYSPQARILLVGEAPAYAELGCGLPLADITAIRYSRCGGCPHLPTCYQHLFGGRGKPGLGPPCRYPGEQPGLRERYQTLVSETRNAGTVLAAAMRYAGMKRSFWHEHGGEVVNVTNVLKLAVDKSRSTERQRKNVPIPSDCVHLLLAEALLAAPKVTVCLGRVASAAVFGRQVDTWHTATVEYRAPFGFVLQTYHPAAILHAGEDAEEGPKARHIRMTLAKAVAIVQNDPRYTTTADLVNLLQLESSTESA